MAADTIPSTADYDGQSYNDEDSAFTISVTQQHLSTEDMFANILTKPVQGAQFERERLGLTNWKA